MKSSEYGVLLSHGTRARDKCFVLERVRCGVLFTYRGRGLTVHFMESRATRATNWMRMTVTSCARTQLAAH